MAEAKATVNAVRLVSLAWKIGDELEAAIKLDPELVDARVELVRYYTMTPRVFGGSEEKARAEAKEIAKRDEALGHFANGYLAYRGKDLGNGRRELRLAVEKARRPQDRVLALTWLGWLSQESQQWADAFAAWETILTIDPKQTAPLYEIGRTASFCTCEREKGEAALRKYLQLAPKGEHAQDAEKLLDRME